MPRYKVYRYVAYVGEIEADNKADAATLMKYHVYPIAWKEVGNPRYKLDGEDNKVAFIRGIEVDDSESRSNN